MPFAAGLFLYRRNNAFLGSAFCSFGALDLTRGLLLLAEASGLLSHKRGGELLQGAMMEGFAYVALSLFIGALRVNAVAVLMTGLAAGGYALSGLPILAG